MAVRKCSCPVEGIDRRQQYGYFFFSFLLQTALPYNHRFCWRNWLILRLFLFLNVTLNADLQPFLLFFGQILILGLRIAPSLRNFIIRSLVATDIVILGDLLGLASSNAAILIKLEQTKSLAEIDSHFSELFACKRYFSLRI
jgi:hypothetical protein